jgi:hypothetical protein
MFKPASRCPPYGEYHVLGEERVGICTYGAKTADAFPRVPELRLPD